jgi:hypothetical protein
MFRELLDAQTVILKEAVACIATRAVHPDKEGVRKSTIGWISALRPPPSREGRLFETTASQLPQDEEFLNAIKDIPHAEERRQARLEARNAALQPFPDTLESQKESLWRFYSMTRQCLSNPNSGKRI